MGQQEDEKRIKVVCAIIEESNPQNRNDRMVLLAKRDKSKCLRSLWKFPGGG
jgi:hypothetical protein